MTVVLGAAIEALNTLSADIIAGNQAPSIYSRGPVRVLSGL